VIEGPIDIAPCLILEDVSITSICYPGQDRSLADTITTLGSIRSDRLTSLYLHLWVPPRNEWGQLWEALSGPRFRRLIDTSVCAVLTDDLKSRIFTQEMDFLTLSEIPGFRFEKHITSEAILRMQWYVTYAAWK
jgi:hypothetical protein